MVEPKKGSKQATMFSFFSPSKSGQEIDETGAVAESKSISAKRPRATLPALKTGSQSVKMESQSAKTESQSAKMEGQSASSPPKPKTYSQKKATPIKPKVQTKSKGKGKTTTSPKPKTKPRKKRPPPVRFISPHAAADSDEDHDEDVFNTPEAKRARAELQMGGDTVPAGALISDDFIVEDAEVIDISEDDGAFVSSEKISGKKKTLGSQGVVDLTAAVTDDVTKCTTETKKVKQLRGKTVQSPKLAKKQQKVKENASDAKLVVVKPLDPVIQARVDTYKLKTEDLTRQYTGLLQSTEESDAVMQDIYGVVLDRDLDVNVEFGKAQEALVKTWQKMQEHALISSNTDSATVLTTVEFPHEVKCLIVKGIQGRTESLSVVINELLATFKKQFEADGEKRSVNENERVDSEASLALEMEIKMLAQRTPHGVRPAKANVFEDTSVDALWVWEVGNLDKYFNDEAQKMIKRMRKNRKRLGQQLKSLARVVHLLHQRPVNEAKVSAEEAKVSKFGIIIDAELQRAKDREMKEQEKRQAALDKKQQELERQQAKEIKEQEKRQRDRKDEEKKKAVSAKRQKRFMAFFDAANSAGTNDSAIDVTGDQESETSVDVDTSQTAVIARMDAAISYLASRTDASSSSVTDVVNCSKMSVLSSFKDKGSARKPLNEAFINGWSARRHRDSKRGVMKLLQFYENSRPAYYGTFSRRVALFHGGRRPLAQYVKFDYSVDSDDEWEEEEPGESLSDDENDGEESEDDNLDYGDQWLAYEDEVDYMDGVETEEDTVERGNQSLSPTKHKLPSQLQKKRVKTKSLKPTKLEPQILGPFWYNDDIVSNDNPFRCLVGELLCEPVFESTMMRKAREYEDECERLEVVRLEQQRKKVEQQPHEKLKTQEMRQKTDVVMQAVQNVAKRTTQVKASQATPQKKSTQKLATPSPNAVKSTPVAAFSPPKASGPQIDSFFKKVEGSELMPLKAHQNPQPADEQKSKDASKEIISVD